MVKRAPIPKNCRIAIRLFVILSITLLFFGLISTDLISCGDKSKVMASHVQIRMFTIALGVFHLDVGRYPSTEEGLAALITRPEAVDRERWKGPYLKRDVPRDPWGNPYQYVFPSRHGQDFDIYSWGADGQSGSNGDDPGDLNNWSPNNSWSKTHWTVNVFYIAAYVSLPFLLLALVIWLLASFIKCVIDIWMKIRYKIKRNTAGT